MNRELLELAADLHRRHRPYVVATVVWSRGPSSGKRGGAALIEPDGTLHGWIGGACAEPAVIREARRVIKDGEPVLMYLGPAEEMDGVGREGVVTVPISCSSEGALEVFMEPVLPKPHVVVVGKSPAVRQLAKLLDAMDWRSTVVPDDELEQLTDLGVDEATAVVVATQGHADEPALEAALTTPAGYIGLVASAKRGESVLGYLRDRGYESAELRRIHTPAGIDLGPIQHSEIAVAVLAELVAVRTSGGLSGAAGVEVASPAETAIDPVCGMTVTVADARWSSAHDGETYYFCAPGCQNAFEKDPERFLQVTS
jgi:xanthine dehydrogenase accessory factor